MSVGRRLGEYREAGEEISAFAKRLGISKQMCALYLYDECVPGIKMVERMAEALGIPPADLAFGEDESAEKARGVK